MVEMFFFRQNLLPWEGSDQMSAFWSMFWCTPFRNFLRKKTIFRNFDQWSEIWSVSAGRPLGQGVCPSLRLGHGVQCEQVQGDARRTQQREAHLHHERTTACRDRGGEGHWSDGIKTHEAISPVQKRGKNSTDSTGTAYEGVPLQGQTCLPPPLHTVCPPTPGVLRTSLVAMAGRGQGLP